jgi:purine-binding chemotaxis protein CheW
MSAAPQQFCTFYIQGLLFGVEVETVQEVIRHLDMTGVPLAPAVVAGLINLRGQIVTAIDLRRRLGVGDRLAGELPMNVVVRTGDGAVSLLVDEIGDVVEVEEKDFEQAPDTLACTSRELIRGVYKLNHELLLVLDTQRSVNISASAGESGPGVQDRQSTHRFGGN